MIELLTIKTFLQNILNPKTIKWILGFIVVLLVLYSGWSLKNIIEENATNRFIINQKTDEISNLNEVISKLKKFDELKTNILEEKNKELEELEQSLFNITNDLGDDSKEAAPESIKELFRRLN
jgi:hypothetical protein